MLCHEACTWEGLQGLDLIACWMVTWSWQGHCRFPVNIVQYLIPSFALWVSVWQASAGYISSSCRSHLDRVVSDECSICALKPPVRHVCRELT
jgi:hypothetical protein